MGSGKGRESRKGRGKGGKGSKGGAKHEGSYSHGETYSWGYSKGNQSVHCNTYGKGEPKKRTWFQGIHLGHMRQAGARNLSFAVTQCNATFLARTCVLKHFHHEILMALLLTFVMVICRRSQVLASLFFIQLLCCALHHAHRARCTYSDYRQGADLTENHSYTKYEEVQI